ncbi:MAG: hypothetical protein JNK48_15055, partial [Bryobacterales bacterium]|nr:hypothetical protein [Bryobacterales bacterium]
MDFAVSLVLTAAVRGITWLARKGQGEGGTGQELPPVCEVANGLMSAIAGNRADAAAANWLKKMRDHWVRLDTDPNHDLLRSAVMASWLACFRLGVEYGARRNLPTEHWSDRLLLGDHLRRWLRRPCSPASSVFREAEAQWLDQYMPGVLREMDRTTQKDWRPPDADSELKRVTGSLEYVAGDVDAESVLARALSAEAWSGVESRWPGAPAELEGMFAREWFGLFCSAFQARLKDDQRVANVFFAGQLSALRREKGGERLTDAALADVRESLESLANTLAEMRRELPVETARETVRLLKEELPGEWRRSGPAYPPEDMPPMVDGEMPRAAQLPPGGGFPYRSLEGRFVGRLKEIWQVHRSL